MTVKKALIISTLAVILTGITAYAISYTKKTGKNPFKTMETNATYYIHDFEQTNNKTTINVYGQPNTQINPYDDIYYKYEIQQLEQNQIQIKTYYRYIKIAGYEVYNPTTSPSLANTTTLETVNGTIQTIELARSTYTANGTANINATLRTTITYADTNNITRNENIETNFFYMITNVVNPDSELQRTNDYINLSYLFSSIENSNYSQGYDTGHSVGYGEGYSDGSATASPIDIRSLMLNVLTMPFTFISQAFNVTMWEGTPYQINLSNLILSLIAIATILFIIKLFTSGFSAIGNYTGNKANSRLDRQVKKSQIKVNESKANLNDRTKGK